MMQAAIYAGYFTELQEERSIEDQLALCREYAAKLGYSVLKEYRDAGLSGASTVNRSGLQQLMAAAKNSQFDIVIGRQSWPASTCDRSSSLLLEQCLPA